MKHGTTSTGMSLFLQLKEKYEKEHHLIDDVRRLVHEDLTREEAELFEILISHIRDVLLDIEQFSKEGNMEAIQSIVTKNLELFN